METPNQWKTGKAIDANQQKVMHFYHLLAFCYTHVKQLCTQRGNMPETRQKNTRTRINTGISCVDSCVKLRKLLIVNAIV